MTRSTWLNTSKQYALSKPPQNGTLGEFLSSEFQDGAQESIAELRRIRIRKLIYTHEGNVRTINRNIDKLVSDLGKEMRMVATLKEKLEK